ncbi:RNA polymerase II subunit A C-terminal domain phosphatase SSU72 [Ramicandelaber brevisporus]|nr:RNA polymerase II subunit A C-terminal domain phosphatase SSU72 [Ramicandelaber brevisporus]
MYHQLLEQNQKLYTRNGLLRMLDRNRRIKKAPQRWQESTDVFDVIITCEERCWRAVMEDLLMRSMISEQVGELGRPVHVVNVDIKDNHTDAALGGKLILEIAKSLEEADDLNGQISDILNSVQESTHHPLLHSIAFY